ncbi:Transposase, partial [Dysosmobacter welbionis]
EKEPLVDSTWNRAPARPLVGLVASTFLTTSVYRSFVTVRLPIITLWTV